MHSSIYAPILVKEEQADGSLMVTGLATDDTLDADEQICDPEWLESAMPSWFKYGNIREQHSNIAAGVATDYKQDGSRHYITAKIVDKNSIAKLKANVLKGFSIGIRNPRVQTDKDAAGGRIVDGEIVEVSIVDRPANPSAILELAKSIGGEMHRFESFTEKREFTTEQREEAADEGAAMPDGSFPILTRADLRNAIQAFGRAKDKEAVRAHIVRRARALDAEDMIPDAWKADKEAVMDEKEMPEDKMDEGKMDDDMEKETEAEEAKESESMEEKEDGDDAKAEDSEKEDEVEESEEHEETEMEMLGRLMDAVARIEGFLAALDKTEDREDMGKSIKALDERVSKVEKSASNGPARTVVKAAPAVAPMEDKAAMYRAKAAATSDPALAEGYLLLAAEMTK